MLRNAIIRPATSLRQFIHTIPRRRFSTEPPPPPPTAQSRIERFNRRLPRFLHKYTSALSSAPLTHITSFLILHEITAIVPLFGLAATFHYTHWLPPYFAEGTWVLQGVERFGKYFRRKGWIRGEDVGEAEHEVQLRRIDHAWNISEGGVRVIVEFATAYAITKVFLPVRIVASVWGTPWFARKAVIPLMGRFKRMFSRGKAKTTGSGGAGTGAVKAGAVPKNSGTGPKP
ncbi:hypothetical protein K458DRAFT_417261 [Lentithecium fluviatile CBS 122367]|uniref:Uncharacterized protein n=1 Tax=Lentithecium fluviatile CBS 122367 TaxID=1168545 RepID=A0A6G1J4R3_9PLEO|nr:hypothetical protein K458DRAFT_417261 [Lentithecium fluviatile CBS 122367]